VLHLHILQEFRDLGHATQAFKLLINELRQNPIYLCNSEVSCKTLLATLPIQNKAILKVADKVNARKIGQLSNSILYNNQIQDVVLYTVEV